MIYNSQSNYNARATIVAYCTTCACYAKTYYVYYTGENFQKLTNFISQKSTIIIVIIITYFISCWQNAAQQYVVILKLVKIKKTFF